MSTAAPSASKPKWSRLAIASLVLAIAGPCTLGLGSVVGLILAIVALVKIGRSGGLLVGTGLAVACLVIAVLGILIVPPLAVAILVPAVHSAMDTARGQASMSNVRQLCIAACQYAVEHDRYPAADTWTEVLNVPETLFADPSDAAGGRGYAINAKVAGAKEGDVGRRGQTVLFFECAKGSPPAGGPELLPPEPRHGRGYIIGFCDGHVERVGDEGVGRLVWDLKGERPNE
jgi:prepilin-type processing-associated H-X9-DG protein